MLDFIKGFKIFVTFYKIQHLNNKNYNHSGYWHIGTFLDYKQLIAMKKLLSGAMVTIFLIFSSCSKSSNSDEMTDDNSMTEDDPIGMAIPRNYEEDIKAIITSNCLSCHSNPPVNNAPMSLETYTDVKNAVENRSLLSRINNSSNPMPPQGQLSTATRQIIADWIDQGMPEN